MVQMLSMQTACCMLHVSLPVELLLQVLNLKLQSLQVAGGCHGWTNCRSWTQEENAAFPPLGYRLL